MNTRDAEANPSNQYQSQQTQTTKPTVQCPFLQHPCSLIRAILRRVRSAAPKPPLILLTATLTTYLLLLPITRAMDTTPASLQSPPSESTSSLPLALSIPSITTTLFLVSALTALILLFLYNGPIIRWLKLKRYQYEVTFSLYMLTPMEKFVFSELPFLLCPCLFDGYHSP
jgi:hypothetical protein